MLSARGAFLLINLDCKKQRVLELKIYEKALNCSLFIFPTHWRVLQCGHIVDCAIITNALYFY